MTNKINGMPVFGPQLRYQEDEKFLTPSRTSGKFSVINSFCVKIQRIMHAVKSLFTTGVFDYRNNKSMMSKVSHDVKQLTGEIKACVLANEQVDEKKFEAIKLNTPRMFADVNGALSKLLFSVSSNSDVAQFLNLQYEDENMAALFGQVQIALDTIKATAQKKLADAQEKKGEELMANNSVKNEKPGKVKVAEVFSNELNGLMAGRSAEIKKLADAREAFGLQLMHENTCHIPADEVNPAANKDNKFEEFPLDLSEVNAHMQAHVAKVKENAYEARAAELNKTIYSLGDLSRYHSFVKTKAEIESKLEGKLRSEQPDAVLADVAAMLAREDEKFDNTVADTAKYNALMQGYEDEVAAQRGIDAGFEGETTTSVKLREQSYYRQEIDDRFEALREETDADVTASLGKFFGIRSKENQEMINFIKDYTDEDMISDTVVKEVGRGVDLIEKGLKQANKMTPQRADDIAILRAYLDDLAEI